MKYLKFSLFFLITILFTTDCDDLLTKKDYENKQEIINLVAFSKLYGYIKFFHPSNEASKIDWNKFGILGSQKVLNCQNNKELIDSLKQLFYPIAHNISIYSSEEKPDKAANKNNSALMYWQHLGVEIKDSSSFFGKSPYKSKRIKSDYVTSKLFDYKPSYGEIIKKEIIPGIYCYIPLTLHKDYKFKKSNSIEKFKILQQQINLITDSISVDNKFVRVADILITWNYVQHFYPYFEVVKVDWEEILFETLASALQDKSRDEFLTTLQKMMAYLNDGHAITKDLLAKYGRLPIKVDLVENQVIATYSEDTTEFKIGDILLEINEKNIQDILLKNENLISGSRQWKKNRALEKICIGHQGSKVKIKLIRDKDTLTIYSLRDHNKYLILDKPKFMELGHKIVYVNLNTISIDEINYKLDKILKAKGVIFDLRVYPNRNHEILCYLIGNKKVSKKWMKIPQIIYPDHKNFHFEEKGWNLKPRYPQLKGEIVFITSSRAISYAESVLGFVKGYNLGEIVGQPTAGANGNGVSFFLPGKFEVWFTGMKVVKHDGSQLHMIGIKPTVYAERTIEGVRSGKDEFLEKAVEILTEKLN